MTSFNLTAGQLQEIQAGLGQCETNTVTYDNVLRGKTGAQVLFSVSGLVAVRLIPRVTTDLASAGGGTLEIGTSQKTTGLIAQTVATALDQYELWNDASPDSSVELLTGFPFFIVDKDIIETVGTAAITAGVIEYNAIWFPLTPSATLTARTYVASASPSNSPSNSPSVSPSASASPSASVSPSSSVSKSSSPSVSPSSSTSPSSSVSKSVSPSASVSPSSSNSPSVSPSP